MIKPVSKDEQMAHLLDGYRTKMIETKGQLQEKARLSDSISFQETKSTLRSTSWNGQPRYVVPPDVAVERELVEPAAATKTSSNYIESLSGSDDGYDLLAPTHPASLVAENALLTNQINRMEQENTKLKEENERIRLQLAKGDATREQADGETEPQKSKILIENRERFMHFIDKSDEESEENIFFFMLLDVVLSLGAYHSFHRGDLKKDSALYLIMPSVMIVLNLLTGLLIYTAKTTYVKPISQPGSTGPRLIAQAFILFTSCNYYITPSSSGTYCLLGFKIVLNAYSLWRIMEETVDREIGLRAFAEIVADYENLSPRDAVDDGSEEQTAAATEDDGAAASAADTDVPAAPPAAEQPFFLEIKGPICGFMLNEDQAVTQFPFVSLVIPRTEVERAGVLRAGHEILSINGISLDGTSTDFAYSLIDNLKGPAKLELRFNPLLADYKYLFLN